MKLKITSKSTRLSALAFFSLCFFMPGITSQAQETNEEKETAVKHKPVKNTFESVWLIDNQTVMVPVKGTMEMDIMHRFGQISGGYQEFWGLFSPSNIRLGLSYAPIDKLNVGVGLTRTTATTKSPLGIKGPVLDGSVKYSIITQTKNKYPVSASYYGYMAYNTMKDDAKAIFKYSSDRMAFFHQLLIARKITDKLSLQIAPSLSHQNTVYGYYKQVDSATKVVANEMKHTHFAVAFSARYKLTDVTSLMINYDQPITKHTINNPNPNLSFGLEFNTSSHSFQLFVTNYYYMNPAANNLYNYNAPFSYDDPSKTHPHRLADDPATANDESTRVKGGRFMIGFNITRLWNY